MAREGDVVLIYHEDNPSVFARVEDIRPDMKKDWYHITLLLLTIPTQMVTWILKMPTLKVKRLPWAESP